ncbi:hypothetical protein C8K36_108244 [Rhodococcus sp. OK519]|uniref:toxin-antitoxin system n=1 Tax=unclassified Rhodococcus (in: high G+C Gram-positive bacteria) TaxID=192944 RepID=UPI000D352B03|nr:hypothetical protein C8K36_108244 [Rhodococcus sp. OK519]
MTTPSKGPRTIITSRVPNDVFRILEDRRHAAGVSSVSQYIADLLASYAGRADLIRELDEKALPNGAVTAA